MGKIFQLLYQPIRKVNPNLLVHIAHPFLVMSLRVLFLKKPIVLSSEQRITNFDLKFKCLNARNYLSH